MRKALVRPKIVWVLVILLILQVSCALKGPPRPSQEVGRHYKGPLPPSQVIGKNLGTIGVASGSFPPELSLQKRTSELAAEAAKGAGEASSGWLQAASGGGGDPLAFCLWLACLPFVAFGGCIIGAMKAEPAEELDEESEEALRNAFQQVHIQEEMRGRILSLASERTNYTFVSLEEQGPSTPDEEFNYSSVTDKNIDTFLELAVLEVGLVGSAKIHPLLQFFMTIRTRLFRAVDGEELYSATVEYRGEKLGYARWTQDDVKYFKEELRNDLDKLSERVVELLFALAWSGRVVEVEEGDILIVRRGREQVKLLLYGIDTPEKDQKFGKRAKRFISERVLQQVVDVEVPYKDRHGQTAAVVRAEGVILNEALVEEGFAWVESRSCKDSICNHWYSLEMEARRERRGLWSEAHPLPH
jgi:endonuclease YncB( thermonuclease family)